MTTKWSVRLFLSADIVGSTAFKAAAAGRRRNWVTAIEEFFTGFPGALAQAHHRAGREPGSPSVWKCLGDELVFSTEVASEDHVAAHMSAFIAALNAFKFRNENEDEEVTPGHELDLKGTAWCGQFPAPNRSVRVTGESTDYIGPTIDTGFRLAGLSTKRRLVVSVELVHLLSLASGKLTEGLTIFYDGRHVLRGVNAGRPYPVFWLDARRNACDLAEDELLGRKKCDLQELRRFCVEFLKPPFYPMELDPRKVHVDLASMADNMDKVAASSSVQEQEDLLTEPIA